MNEELTLKLIQQVLGTLSFGRRLLSWDSFEYHILDSVKTGLKNLNVDQVTVLGGCTKYIQAPDVSWNEPFKSRCTEEYDNWFRNGKHQYTEAGNMRPPPRREVLKWILLAWDSLPYEVIVKSFKSCALTLALDGFEDHLIHCFKHVKKEKSDFCGRYRLCRDSGNVPYRGRW